MIFSSLASLYWLVLSRTLLMSFATPSASLWSKRSSCHYYWAGIPGNGLRSAGGLPPLRQATGQQGLPGAVDQLHPLHQMGVPSLIGTLSFAAMVVTADHIFWEGWLTVAPQRPGSSMWLQKPPPGHPLVVGLHHTLVRPIFFLSPKLDPARLQTWTSSPTALEQSASDYSWTESGSIGSGHQSKSCTASSTRNCTDCPRGPYLVSPVDHSLAFCTHALTAAPHPTGTLIPPWLPLERIWLCFSECPWPCPLRFSYNSAFCSFTHFAITYHFLSPDGSLLPASEDTLMLFTTILAAIYTQAPVH